MITYLSLFAVAAFTFLCSSKQMRIFSCACAAILIIHGLFGGLEMLGQWQYLVRGVVCFGVFCGCVQRW